MESTIETVLAEIEAHEPTINAELLLRVAEHVEAHPKELDMFEWGKKKRKPSDVATLMGQQIVVKAGEQYTVGCIACRAVILSGGTAKGNNAAQAQRLCGLTFEQAQRLFYVQNWPEPFRANFFFANESKEDSEGRAWITAERIRHFVATGL